MTASPVAIVGFSSTDKVPGFVGEVLYGAGPISASSIPTYCLCVGTKLTSGIATADVDVVDIRSTDDADTYFGAGSELARMCRSALRVAGTSLKAMAVSEAVGAAAATATITIGSTWTTAGAWYYRIDGIAVSGGISSADTATTVATAIASAINQNPRMPCTAASTGGVVTLTRKSKGARGNWGSVYQDASKLPSGAAATILSGASGATAQSGNVMVRFGGGTGVETATAAIANLFAGQYDYIALAQNDLTTLTAAGSWRDSNTSKAAPLEGRPQFVTVCTNDTLTNGTALAQGVNDQLIGVLWYNNGETPPWEVAAYFAALRQVSEQADPGCAYDGAVLAGVLPQTVRSDRPSRTTQVSALNSGLTPITSTDDGRAIVVRAITSRCLNGTTPDYRTLDTSDAAVPQYVRKDIGLFWTTSFKLANPRVADDVPLSAPPRPSGVATPALWSAAVTNLLRGYEKGVNGSPPLLIDVDQNLPTSGYDATARRIMTLCPVKPAPNQHQIGVSIRQVVLSTK